jgi:hypothetical protein
MVRDRSDLRHRYYLSYICDYSYPYFQNYWSSVITTGVSVRRIHGWFVWLGHIDFETFAHLIQWKEHQL